MHKIVFEMTADGAEQWESVLNNAENVRRAFGADAVQVEIVLHGKSLGLVTASTDIPALHERVRSLSSQGIMFAACANTMKKQGVTKEQLLPQSVVVDSGVAEVVRKQEQGWSYIKAGH